MAHRRGNRLKRGAAIAACLVWGCVALPHATPAQLVRLQARWPEVTQQALEEGRRTYALRCSGCHLLYLPAGRTHPQWLEVMDDMAIEAELRGEERRRIELFLEALAKPDAEPVPVAGGKTAPRQPSGSGRPL